MESFQTDTHLIAFLDILGFTNLVSRRSSEEIYAVLAMLWDTKDNLVTSAYVRKIIDSVEMNLIGDAIILRYKLDAPLASTDSKNLFFFFTLSAWVFITLMKGLQILLRGGIAIGNYYNKRLPGGGENKFISGTALIKAVVQERKACYPRILLSEELTNFAQLHNELQDVVANDEDGFQFLDIYRLYFGGPAFEMHQLTLFEDIAQIMHRFKEDKTIISEDIQAKMDWFFKFHNKKVKEYRLDQKYLIGEV